MSIKLFSRLFLLLSFLMFSVPALAATYDVTYTDTGFSPTSVTLVVGDTVRWTNVSAANYVEIASDPHPTHTEYPALNLGTVNPNGGTASLTFSDSGTFGYHNHLNPGHTGTVIVSLTPSPTPSPSPAITPTPSDTVKLLLIKYLAAENAYFPDGKINMLDVAFLL